jgi:hypothetical protein
MNMQDNEFDDQFRSKLDNFEIEPSAQVWQNIDAQLDEKRRKRSIFPMLGIAASIIVLITAGILFVPKKENIRPDHHQKDGLAVKVTPPVMKPEIATPANLNQPKIETIAVKQPSTDQITIVSHAKNIDISISPKQPDAQQTAKAEPAKADEQQPEVIAEIQKPAEPIQLDAPDNSTELVAKTPVDDINETKLKPQVIAQIPVSDKRTQQPKKHGIRNFGDIVNLVVAKVDKRKDKVIEFSDADEDGSSITGINLGVIKVKKGE